MGLRYATVTGVARDDLPDEGAWLHAETVRAIHAANPGTGVEILATDFSGNPDLLAEVFASRPEVFAHNVETVPRIFKRIRPAFRYERSLDVLTQARDAGLITKSNLILGMGEEPRRDQPGAAGPARRRHRHHHDHPVPAPDAAAPAGRALGHARRVRRDQGGGRADRVPRRARRAARALELPRRPPVGAVDAREGPRHPGAPAAPRRCRTRVRASRSAEAMARPSTPEKEPGRIKQMWQVFQMTRRYDSAIVPLLLARVPRARPARGRAGDPVLARQHPRPGPVHHRGRARGRAARADRARPPRRGGRLLADRGQARCRRRRAEERPAPQLDRQRDARRRQQEPGCRLPRRRTWRCRADRRGPAVAHPADARQGARATCTACCRTCRSTCSTSDRMPTRCRCTRSCRRCAKLQARADARPRCWRSATGSRRSAATACRSRRASTRTACGRRGRASSQRSDPHQHRPGEPVVQAALVAVPDQRPGSRGTAAACAPPGARGRAAPARAAPRACRRIRCPMLPLTIQRKTSCSTAKIAERDPRVRDRKNANEISSAMPQSMNERADRGGRAGRSSADRSRESEALARPAGCRGGRLTWTSLGEAPP